MRDCVPPTQWLCPRKRNWASAGCEATAPIVAKSFGVSTPLRGAGGAFRAGVSIVVTGVSISDLHWVDVLKGALACPGRFDRTSEGRLRRWKAGKGQASETRRRNTNYLGAVLDLQDNRIVWWDTALLFPRGVARAPPASWLDDDELLCWYVARQEYDG